MSETGQGRFPPSTSLSVQLFTSPTWQISIPPLQLPFLLLTHTHTPLYYCWREAAQGTYCSNYELCHLSFIHVCVGLWSAKHSTSCEVTEQRCLALCWFNKSFGWNFWLFLLCQLQLILVYKMAEKCKKKKCPSQLNKTEQDIFNCSIAQFFVQKNLNIHITVT